MNDVPVHSYIHVPVCSQSNEEAKEKIEKKHIGNTVCPCMSRMRSLYLQYLFCVSVAA